MRENEASVDQRLLQLVQWLDADTRFGGMPVDTASADASFRRYFRITGPDSTWIAMDAPPEKEDSEPFVRIAGLMADSGVRVPEIYHSDLSKGFMVLEDFGNVHFEDALSQGGNRDALYDQALQAMLPVTTLPTETAKSLPPFDRTWMVKELLIFYEWFLAGDGAEKSDFDKWSNLLIDGILEQPLVVMHRDFHGRNLLMIEEGKEIGVIDFQGAMQGPLTYDLGSLLKDCYQDNPADWIRRQALGQKVRYEEAFHAQWEDKEFLKWLDWTGLQRHLKVLGLFRRLHVRDGKDRYLKDLPRVWGYANDVLERYPELSGFLEWIETFETWKEYQQ